MNSVSHSRRFVAGIASRHGDPKVRIDGDDRPRRPSERDLGHARGRDPHTPVVEECRLDKGKGPILPLGHPTPLLGPEHLPTAIIGEPDPGEVGFLEGHSTA